MKNQKEVQLARNIVDLLETLAELIWEYFQYDFIDPNLIEDLRTSSPSDISTIIQHLPKQLFSSRAPGPHQPSASIPFTRQFTSVNNSHNQFVVSLKKPHTIGQIPTSKHPKITVVINKVKGYP